MEISSESSADIKHAAHCFPYTPPAKPDLPTILHHGRDIFTCCNATMRWLSGMTRNDAFRRHNPSGFSRRQLCRSLGIKLEISSDDYLLQAMPSLPIAAALETFENNAIIIVAHNGG